MDGSARAKATRAFGAEIARGNFYDRTLFTQAGVTSVQLSDPIRPVSHLMVTRLLRSAASARFVEQLISAVGGAVPATRLMVFEFADPRDFKPVAANWQELANHRTMAVRVVHYRGTECAETGPWLDLPHAMPWPYFRDVLIPFAVTRQGEKAPGFVQPFHGAIFALLHPWLCQAFGSEKLPFSAFCADAGSGKLNSNPQDQGGGLLPVTPSIAIVGDGMSAQMREALHHWDIDLVNADVPTESEHADELFSVLPDANTPCGRALITLSPVAGDNEKITQTTLARIRQTTGSVCEALRRKPELESLRSFELPVHISDRHTTDFNPVNMVSLPAEDGVLCLLGKPNEVRLERTYRDALKHIGEALGYRIETRFVDLRGMAPNHKGSLHCATIDLREA